MDVDGFFALVGEPVEVDGRVVNEDAAFGAAYFGALDAVTVGAMHVVTAEEMAECASGELHIDGSIAPSLSTRPFREESVNAGNIAA